MNGFVDFFLKIRNSKFFNSLVISVILASALYAGVSSYDIPSNYIYLLEVFDYAITIFFTIFYSIQKIKINIRFEIHGPRTAYLFARCDKPKKNY